MVRRRWSVVVFASSDPPASPSTISPDAAEDGLEPLVVVVEEAAEDATGVEERVRALLARAVGPVEPAEQRDEEVVRRHLGVGGADERAEIIEGCAEGTDGIIRAGADHVVERGGARR